MISSDMPIVPLPKSQEVSSEGKMNDLMLDGESLPKPNNSAGAAGAPTDDFVDHFAAQDFGACSSALLKELKGIEETDLLPLLVGLLGHIGGVEFADQADQRQRRRGAFSKSVQEGAQTVKVPEPEAFRRLRRAAFPPDAKTLISHELGDRLLSDNASEISGDVLLRFGFMEGRRGSEDLRRAMSDELGDEQSLREEPCGF
mmetsp:Transcript_16719/g.20526  ORF Transcript_16719/g.20526 Transcript_16719/m.20526 type:complete len:201 (+) Transcript_16719:28-630(+)